jgi:predicted nuclease of restriction endonuclease-like RecB superfamily
VLRKAHLRVSRAGGGYHPQFSERRHRPLAARVLGTFADGVGESRAALDDALEGLESDAEDFKFVRGLAALCERDATFETRAAVPPERARRVAFEAAEDVGVVTESERDSALARAADRLGVDADTLESSLYADRESRQVMVEFDPRWSPDELLEQYDLSLAQTALFDATEVRVRSSDPKALVTAVKRLGLMYEVRETESGREVVVTGPDRLFRRTRRYGTAFARLLRTVAAAPEWRLEATIDDRGTERELTLADDDISVPGVDPVTEPTYDSGVEADFAARFTALDLDWDLVREPEPLAAGASVLIPDFAFDYRPEGREEAGFRVLFEIMGFWTPEYVESKLSKLDAVDDETLLVAVDASLGVGEEIEARDHRAIVYEGSVRVKDVVDVLREYEADLVAGAAADLPAELVPDADAVTLSTLAADRGVSVDALESVAFPDHERVGRTLVRPAVLDELGERLEPGQSLAEVESVLDEYGIEETSAVLSALGLRVEWEGLSGGTLRTAGE